MASAQQQELRSVDDLDLIVDTDSHVIETIDDILPYVDDRFDAVKDLIESTAHPEITIYSGSTVLPPFPDSYQVQLDEGYTPENKAEEMERFGIDYSIVEPSLNLSISGVDNAQCAVALANAYNSWVADTFLDYTDTYKGVIVVPTQKPGEAAKEINRRASEGGFVAVQIHALGAVPPPGNEKYDRLYEAAEDNGLPIIMHGGNLGMSKVFPIQRQWAQTFVEDHSISHPFGHMWNITNMIFQGIPEKFPDLDFVLQEAGIGWMPYMISRLDDHYLESQHELPGLSRMPSEYIRDQFYLSTQPLGHAPDNPEWLAHVIDFIGPDSIMYSADLPHGDFDPPEELFDRINPHFEPDDVRSMMGETAIDVFGL